MTSMLLERSDSAPDRERDWLERIRAGEVAPFAALFEAYHTRLCRFADGYVNCPDTAQEIVSDVFMRVWEQRRSWSVTGGPGAYLYAAVRNRALDHLRHAKVRARVHAGATRADRVPGMGEPPASPEEELRLRELESAVRETIEELPARAREAFLLQRRENLTYVEIARAMGISVGTVEKHISRAIGALRDRISG